MVIGMCTDVFGGNFFWLGERSQGEGVTWDGPSIENLYWGKKNSMKVVQDFLAFLKKNETANVKKFFSSGCKEQH